MKRAAMMSRPPTVSSPRNGSFRGARALARWARRAVTGVLLASPAAAAGQLAERLHVPPLPIDTFTLDNGLRVVVSEDRSTPVVAVEMWIHVGSALEPPGRSGFAHLFEHLLFEDTEAMVDGEFGRLIHRAGGTWNGATDHDRTAFNELLPANRLNLSLWTHGERMGRLRISDDDFETQREVVKEERRLRVDNQPYAASRLSLDTVAFRGWEPYRRTVVGSMDDLDAATAADARAFYERWYAPNHAVLVVVGDVDAATVRSMAERYLGDLRRGPGVPDLPAPLPLPRTDGERRRVEPAPLARLPLIWMAWNLPPADHPDHPALAVLAQVLATGESSRMRSRLVAEDGVALDVVAQVERRRGPGLFVVGAVPNAGISVDRVEGLLDDEIDRVVAEGITVEELEAARNRILTGAVTQRMTVAGKAALLQSYVLHFGSPHRVNDELDRFREVTPDDVRRVAAAWLGRDNRSVVVARPPELVGEGR